MRTHYRAHKLSFWLHLVPDLMKNGYGVSSGSHHLLNSGDMEAGNHSVTPPPPTIQLVGPPLWEHNTNNKQNGHFFQGNCNYTTLVTLGAGGSTGTGTAELRQKRYRYRYRYRSDSSN